MSKLSEKVLLSFYRFMKRARLVDETEASFVKQGKAFFHMPGVGHESIITVFPFLKKNDYLACHYRDKALMLARGARPFDFFNNMFANAESDSAGRQMSAFLHSRELNLVSLSGPVANSALQACGIAMQISHNEDIEKNIVYCALGDGMTQEGEVYEAMLYAMREKLPVLFVVENNKYAISTSTEGKTFFSTENGNESSFCGIPITYLDGLDFEKSYEVFENLIQNMRKDFHPQIVIFNVDRLSNHTNADDQTVYRSESELSEAFENHDPLKKIKSLLAEMNVDDAEIIKIDEEEASLIRNDLNESLKIGEPDAEISAKKAFDFNVLENQNLFVNADDSSKSFTMNEAINRVLYSHLKNDRNVSLLGEDIEDPKGDVFGVTKGLSKAFPEQVFNSPLAEATIAGVCAGRAMAGGKPVAFIQFADFFPVAMNQLFSEIGNMYWRTNGKWQTPVIFMVTCGAYKPGLGPFHASTLESLYAQLPGIDIFMPSNAIEAAGLLNTAFESGRPTIFFYPKNVLNVRSCMASSKDLKKFINPEKARFVKKGTDITLIGWGNTVSIISEVAKTLEENGKFADVIDVMSISPWDKEGIIKSVNRTKKVIIVQEANISCSFASEIAATIAENVCGAEIKRISRPDTYVPFNYRNQLEILPSCQNILEASVKMLGGQFYKKESVAEEKTESIVVKATGSSPSDEVVTVVEWKIKEGEKIKQGDIIALMEADKASFEYASPLDGTVSRIFVKDGEMVDVGKPLFAIDNEAEKECGGIVKATGSSPSDEVVTVVEWKIKEGDKISQGDIIALMEADKASFEYASPSDGTVSRIFVKDGEMVDVGKPLFAFESKSGNNKVSVQKEESENYTLEINWLPKPLKNIQRKNVDIGIAEIASQVASHSVTTEEMENEHGWENLAKKNGIRKRFWASEDESSVSLGVQAARKVLAKAKLTVNDIDVVICATGSNEKVSPSLACLIVSQLENDRNLRQPGAYDISAACSGYLYGLLNAYDFINSKNDAKVLLITSETLSKQVDKNDMGTAPIFGDAATASIICSSETMSLLSKLNRPLISSAAEDGSILNIPRNINEHIFMNGPEVFLSAVKEMGSILSKACTNSGVTPQELSLIVPHQANQRIINAIRQKNHLKEEQMFSNIAEYGNTSSSSIPLCLEQIFEKDDVHGKIGLCAFGAGFVYASCIMEI